MKAYLYPGQGSQFTGMGREEFDSHSIVQELYERANEILGYRLSDVMFEGSVEDLKQTRITQPAIFVHSVARTRLLGDKFTPEAAAGHSLGEFSALTAVGAISFEDGLRLVYERAEAMQEACEKNHGTMAAIVGLEDEMIENICAGIDDIVVPANYNCPGQLVISGTVRGVKAAVDKLEEAGARRAIVLQVGGAFHSPLMEPARERLQEAINAVEVHIPKAPVYQNVSANATSDPELIKTQLVRQLTAPVKWSQTLHQMVADGVDEFTEVGGRGGILAGFVRRIDRKLPVESI